jgi:predicted nuclease with TOPRIM domain
MMRDLEQRNKQIEELQLRLEEAAFDPVDDIQELEGEISVLTERLDFVQRELNRTTQRFHAMDTEVQLTKQQNTQLKGEVEVVFINTESKDAVKENENRFLDYAERKVFFGRTYQCHSIPGPFQY